MTSCHILIVDDDPDDIDILCASFQEIGVKNAHGVQSMQRAIELLESITDEIKLPAIIITDLNMPRQNGYELLKFIKASTRYKQIPIIVLSTSLSSNEIKKSLGLGALGYIPKPVLKEEYINLAVKIKSMIKNDS